MFITTSARTNEMMKETAKSYAHQLGVPYKERNKRTVKAMQAHFKDACMVIGKERIELFGWTEKSGTGNAFFFHPNSASFRIKRLERGEDDPLIAASNLNEGMTFLDCTLGLGSDSIVASHVVGESGNVVGTEANRYLSFMVKEGLSGWDSGHCGINEAMMRIKVVHMHHLEYLNSLPDESFDCIYFDPMFEDSINESEGIKGLKDWAVYEDITSKAIAEAKRVAIQRVVLKDSFRSSRFEKYGFDVIRRKNSKFHFGVITKT
ncbi:class I SAM-dependent methyltransferase [Falsibacillus albus]|uniref:Protein-L-IsoD(D-D) O-methyltransferase n=1 Tax=Falsibacillus albus TaxID=2478915 RepID=A0A3L7JWQ5_9BACI|nr:class I SAM-dependent methyltransferase [Falsibacillus albus]RLQ95176.1 hypothetical protein D9X91_11825 [Falsibacillus albus]